MTVQKRFQRILSLYFISILLAFIGVTLTVYVDNNPDAWLRNSRISLFQIEWSLILPSACLVAGSA